MVIMVLMMAGGGEAQRVTVTIYLDVFFIINFMMDYLLLFLVRQMLHLPAPGKSVTGKKLRSYLRIGAAAAGGSLWACAAVFLPGIPGWLEWSLTWFFAGGVMILLAFGRKTIREFSRCMAALWLASVAAGGIFALLGDTVPAAWYLTGLRAVRQWSFAGIGCVAAGIFFGGRACAEYLRERIQMQEHLYQVTLHYRGKTKTVRALRDTGNQLYEPYGHQPVHVITREVCDGLCERVSQVIYIPFRSVGTGYGMLPGIQVDEMDVIREGKLVKSYEKPWLAISREPLSPGHQYEMLLHGEL